MAITKGTGTATSGNLTTGFTLVINSGVQVDDILVIGITNRDGTGNPTCTDNEGAGTWTRITTQAAGTNGSLSIWWKRASANTASKTITVGSCVGSASGYVLPFRGASLAANPFGTPVGEANASGNETQAEITTTRAGSMVIHLVGCTSNDTLAPGNRTATTPSTITEAGEGVSSGGSDCSMSFAADTRSAAGATGAISWAQTDGTGASIAIELLPAWDPITASVGSFALSGTAATFPHTYIAALVAGTFALSGQDAGVFYGRKVVVDNGSFAMSGQDVTLTYTPNEGVTLTAEGGSFALTGGTAELEYGHRLPADGGAFALTGQDTTFPRGYMLSASGGSLALAGQDVTLTHGVPNHYTLTADGGAFAFTGQDATLAYGIPSANLTCLGSKLGAFHIAPRVGGRIGRH